MEEKKFTLEKQLKGIRRNISLTEYTTFKIGGKAKYFFIARTKEELIRAVQAAGKLNLPFFILGGGSNILVSDKGFDGLVIKTQNTKYTIPRTRASSVRGRQNTKITAESGMPLALLVSETTKNNLSGLEWAVGIPGTVGGAIYGNAGTKEEAIGGVVKEVEVFNIKTKRIKKFSKKDCRFNYRESIFKKNNNLIILSVVFQLKKGKESEIKNRIKENLQSRKEKQPLNFPSAGSVFKNPSGFFAGKLIQDCGLKGKRIGNVKISEKHANFIVNLGGGKAKDVKKLINLIENKVKKKFGIVLEEEIQFLGF